MVSSDTLRAPDRKFQKKYPDRTPDLTGHKAFLEAFCPLSKENKQTPT